MRTRTLLVAAVTAGLAFTASPAWGAGPSPDTGPTTAYQLPFRCGQTWTGTTRKSHSPSPDAIDFNRKRDKGQPVTAAAPGVVTTAKNLGDTSYGRYVVIDHGNGETTLYAHLKAMWVVTGQTVDQGEVIGQLGSSGNSTGPHLHFEERKDKTDVPVWFNGVAYTPDTTIASANCVDTPIVGDWDGDGVDDLGVFRRSKGQGRFRRLVGGTTAAVKFGRSYEQPLVGDWDGDGLTDVGVFVAKKGTVETRTSKGVLGSVAIGGLHDRVVSGDWDGDGTDELAVWRPRRAAFGIPNANGRLRWVALGSTGDLPVTGDFNGDGIGDLGVFDPVTATWTLRYVGSDGLAWTTQTTYGAPGDLPVVGDWNGDGVDDLGAWDPATAAWSRRGVDPDPGATSSTPTANPPQPVTYGRPRG